MCNLVCDAIYKQIDSSWEWTLEQIELK